MPLLVLSTGRWPSEPTSLSMAIGGLKNEAAFRDPIS